VALSIKHKTTMKLSVFFVNVIFIGISNFEFNVLFGKCS
jgi:hypothetical protein